jgi:D-sedoheptulose 7-phosphate isomerase
MLAAAAIDERVACGERFFTAEHEHLARLCHRMAERFSRGGRLVAFGCSPADESDVRHVAVEFVHPVIVGKRALPALGVMCADAALLVRPDDVTMAFGSGVQAAAATRAARAAGCLTIGFGEVGAEHELLVGSGDPFLAQEQVETAYHVLWELVHVFFDHRGLLEGRRAGPLQDAGPSSFLYPFLGEQESDLEAVVQDVRASVLMKAHETAGLRRQTVTENAGALAAAAAELRASLTAGGRLLALGNGGSATDAMDVVADFRTSLGGGPARAALDLTEDAAILTAIANDIGPEAIFARQVIAHGRPGDMLLALSTSGTSGSVIAALQEARRRDVRTIAMVGYDGGRVAAERLADHVVITRSEHIPRIQEAQATAYHLLRSLVEER